MTDDEKTTVTVMVNGGALKTPQGNALCVPTAALADAIAREWQASKKFVASQMPLTALAYTAIDRIAGQERAIVEALMVYIDTDTLCYHASEAYVHQEQEKQWGPVLLWGAQRFGAPWQITQGLQALEQSPVLHAAIEARLMQCSAMQLSALSVLASLYSSLLLALMVLDAGLDAREGFRLSRLEETMQAARWGEDEEAAERAKKMQAETVAAGHFLRLLEPGVAA